VGGQGLGQQPAEPAESPPPTRSSRVRLPAYFSAVVNRTQREEIYKIQLAYLRQIEKLEQQISELEMKRDQEVDSVLEPEQLAAVKKRREATETRRRARRQPPADSESTESS
jgi:Spy/CpxP family protein refolding chaperone